MVQPTSLTDFQIEIAGLFFSLPQAAGFLVAGGAGLIASHLVERPTQDLDLFASRPVESVSAATQAFLAVLEHGGYTSEVIQHGPSFTRLIVSRAEQTVLVDLAIDSPPANKPTMTVLGPTLAPLELAARKLLALFGRAEARDFADVYRLATRFGKEVLVEQARALDAGFDLSVLSQMMGTIDRFMDDEIPLPGSDIPTARAFFSAWAAELRG